LEIRGRRGQFLTAVRARADAAPRGGGASEGTVQPVRLLRKRETADEETPASGLLRGAPGPATNSAIVESVAKADEDRASGQPRIDQFGVHPAQAIAVLDDDRADARVA
jgi:hypothetical protein